MSTGQELVSGCILVQDFGQSLGPTALLEFKGWVWSRTLPCLTHFLRHASPLGFQKHLLPLLVLLSTFSLVPMKQRLLLPVLVYPRVKINIRRGAKFLSEELAAHAMTKELAFNGAFIIHLLLNKFKLLMESFIKNFCIHTRFWVEALKKPLG